LSVVYQAAPGMSADTFDALSDQFVQMTERVMAIRKRIGQCDQVTGWLRISVYVLAIIALLIDFSPVRIGALSLAFACIGFRIQMGIRLRLLLADANAILDRMDELTDAMHKVDW
jgi:hypothetical protein